MKNIHVSDFDIQQFLFDPLDCEAQIIKHINSCEECKKRVDTYVLLSSSIKNQTEPELEYNLAQLVLDEIPSNKEIAHSDTYLNTIIILTTSFVLLILVLFRETFVFLIYNTIAQQSYFVISIAFFISFILVYDIFKTFNTKLEILNS